jgi:hypothetical protein
MKGRAVNWPRKSVRGWLWLLALSAILAGLSGCATSEPDNASVRPWNTPQSWENGMSGMMNQQHY